MKERAEYDKDVQALVNDLKKGHEPSFDYLFTTRYEDLCRFAHAFVGSFEAAEDVVQDVFIKIWEKNITISNSASLDSYLYVAVRNGCVSYARKTRSSVGLEKVEDHEAEDVVIEDWQFVWEAVESLPEQRRLVLKLVVLEDMKYAEVAERLGISLNTVKTQMRMAYRELRQKFTVKELTLLFCYFSGNEAFIYKR